MKDDDNLLGLATVRRNRGISLQQISQATKISVRCLEAIEHGAFNKLPGGIYTTSYIRQYADAIDYDPSLILAAYHRDVTHREEQKAKSTASSPPFSLQTVPR